MKSAEGAERGTLGFISLYHSALLAMRAHDDVLAQEFRAAQRDAPKRSRGDVHRGTIRERSAAGSTTTFQLDKLVSRMSPNRTPQHASAIALRFSRSRSIIITETINNKK